MQPIYFEKDGEPVCLLVDASKAPIISEKHYQLLLPHVSKQLDMGYKCHIEDNMIKIVLNDNLINKELLRDICYKFMKNLSEKIIVPQVVKKGLPTIRHRPLHFSISDENNGIVARYEELGEFNSIDNAINCL